MKRYDFVKPTDKWRSGKPPLVAVIRHLYTDDDIEIVTSDGECPIVFADEIEVIHNAPPEAEKLLVDEKNREFHPVKKALQVITTALKEDPGYFYSWQANIAMAFKDEFWKPEYTTHSTTEEIHEIANKAAINFLNLLCK